MSDEARRLEWSRTALDDLDDVVEYLAADDVRTATLVVDRIEAACLALADRHTGRPGRVEGTYEKSVGRTSYIVAYIITDDTVSIARVLHAARDRPPGGWPD